MDRVDIRILLNSVLSLESINERILARQEISHTNCDELKEIFKTRNKSDFQDARRLLINIISKAEEIKAQLP